MIGFLWEQFSDVILGVIAGIGLGLVSFLAGRKKERRRNDVRRLDAYKQTRGRIDDAKVLDDADAARDWLRDRAGE